MPVELQARIAERLFDNVMFRLYPSPRNKIACTKDALKGAALAALSEAHETVNKVICTKDALKEAVLAALSEAHEIGFLAGQKEQYFNLTRPGSQNRPAWMDIRLDDPDDLARNHVQFKPVVLKSLLDAGYRRLGDLRWVSNRELSHLRYIGWKTARQVLAMVRRFERNAESDGADSVTTSFPA